MNSEFLVLLFIAGCFSQTPLPTVQISSSPATSSTPLPPSLPSVSPYFNGFRSIFPQQYIGGPYAPQQYIGGPIVPQQYIGGPNPNVPLQQRFINSPNPYNSQFVPILQQSFDITPEGSYSFRQVARRLYKNMFNFFTKYVQLAYNNNPCINVLYNIYI